MIRVQQGWYEILLLDLPIFIGATFSVCYFYWISQRIQGRSAGEILRLLPAVLALGIGVSVNNAKGVIEALIGHQSPFIRTPKYAIEHRSHQKNLSQRLYLHKNSILPALELSLGLWFSYAIWCILTDPGQPLASLPFLLLFQFGFFYVAFVSIGQSLRRFRRSS